MEIYARSEHANDIAQLIVEAAHVNADILIHMAGYADARYTDQEKSDSSFNIGSFSPIFPILYRDLVMLASCARPSRRNSSARAACSRYSAGWQLGLFRTADEAPG